MNKKDLSRRVASVMRENDVRKPVTFRKKIFHISDDEGNSSDFIMKSTSKGVLFTNDDVEAMLDACIQVVEDALAQGEEVSVRGFGSLGLHYRKARKTRHPETGEIVDVPGRYSPKFQMGTDLKTCAKLYELSLGEDAIPSDIELEGGEDDGD